jgi:hypothetical protein
MSWTLECQLLAFVFYFLYGSFFEWAFHKYLFHSPKFVKRTFKAHTLVHHQRYKYVPASYEWQEGQEKDHIAMDWFALPMFIGFHLPFLWLAQWATGIPSIWGGLAAITSYYIIYEYFHYCMHVPGKRAFEKTRLFRFVKEHHRIHHKYMLQNLNVFFPLADVCLGTYRSAVSVPLPRTADDEKPVLAALPLSAIIRPLSNSAPAQPSVRPLETTLKK